jgi:choline kinase
MFDLDRLVIVVAERYVKLVKNDIKAYLDDGLDVVYVSNPYPERENGYSLMLAVDYVDTDVFLLSVADHIYTYGVVKKLVDDYNSSIDFLVGGDSSPKYINIDEATKIRADDNGRVLNIGKKITRYTHIDIGVFIVRRYAVEDVRYLMDTEKIKLSDVIMELAKREYGVYVSDVVGNVWTDVDTVDDVQEILYGERRAVVETVLQELLENG